MKSQLVQINITLYCTSNLSCKDLRLRKSHDKIDVFLDLYSINTANNPISTNYICILIRMQFIKPVKMSRVC